MGPEMAIDIASWLRQLGLAQYEPAFRDNDVDGDVLPDLTAEDLIAIGVTSVGHRRKLLSAIARSATRPRARECLNQHHGCYRTAVYPQHRRTSDLVPRR
jgi:hypothetical protein